MRPFRPGWRRIGTHENLSRAAQGLADSHPCQNPPPSLRGNRLAGKLPGEGKAAGVRTSGALPLVAAALTLRMSCRGMPWGC